VLRSIKELSEYTFHATDGEIGRVRDSYFDEAWVIRYIVVETGAWLSERNILLSPAALELGWQEDQTLVTTLSREQVKQSPEIANLRSIQEVLGYQIEARDGEIGYIEDFIFDDESWTLQYMVINTGGWLPGKRVLLAPSWVQQVNWNESEVRVDLNRETVKNSPEYNSAEALNLEYETELHDYYQQPKYWL
jgi:hypothetical protein